MTKVKSNDLKPVKLSSVEVDWLVRILKVLPKSKP